MILTGKAREDFLNHLGQPQVWYELMKESPTILCSLIVDWFDSVGIHIEVGVYPESNGNIYFSFTIYGDSSSDDFDFYKVRQIATDHAILKANEIYNERK